MVFEFPCHISQLSDNMVPLLVNEDHQIHIRGTVREKVIGKYRNWLTMGARVCSIHSEKVGGNSAYVITKSVPRRKTSTGGIETYSPNNGGSSRSEGKIPDH
jgi:hypothetical protein